MPPDLNLPYLALAGPTASGKTAAALSLAKEFDIEIISVDSALVYRGMDIGTAKPTNEERALVPHHLIDIRDPSESYNAGEFIRDTVKLIQAIQARKRLPLLVGGTMLYFKALNEGLDEMPAANIEIRKEIEKEANLKGWDAMHYELETVDPSTAKRLHTSDTQRIQRALEVFRISGKPLSSFHTKANNLAPQQMLISLEPRERSWLHKKIQQRFDAMLSNGFLDEVTRLKSRGDLSPQLPAMRCVGYRQAWQALEEGWSRTTLREQGIVATRQLAKRQLTWLRSMKQRHAVACDDTDAISQVLKLSSDFFKKKNS